MNDLFNHDCVLQQVRDAITDIRARVGLSDTFAVAYDLSVICDQLMLQSNPGSVWYFGVRECGIDTAYGQCDSIFTQRPSTPFFGVVRVQIVEIQKDGSLLGCVTKLSVSEARAIPNQSAGLVERCQDHLQLWQVHSLISESFNVRPEFVQLLPNSDFIAVMGCHKMVLIIECEDLNYLAQSDLDYLSGISGRGHTILRFRSVGESGTFFAKPEAVTPSVMKRMLAKRAVLLEKKMAARVAA